MMGAEETANAFGQRYFEGIGDDDDGDDTGEVLKRLLRREAAVNNDAAGNADPEKEGEWIDGIDEEALEPEARPVFGAGGNDLFRDVRQRLAEQGAYTENDEQEATDDAQGEHKCRAGDEVFDVRQPVIHGYDEQHIADPDAGTYGQACAKPFFDAGLEQGEEDGACQQTEEEADFDAFG